MRPEAGGVISAIVVFAFFAIFAGHSGFLTSSGRPTGSIPPPNLGSSLSRSAMLMIGGEFDLSVGAMVGATSMVMAICSGYYDLTGIGALARLRGGGASALLNGIIVVRTRLPSFIVTLSTMLMVTGGISACRSL